MRVTCGAEHEARTTKNIPVQDPILRRLIAEVNEQVATSVRAGHRDLTLDTLRNTCSYDPMRERVHLVGGPGDGMTVEVPDGQQSVQVVLVTRRDQSWVQVDTAPRGMLQGEVVGAGCYARTEWEQGGLAVYRYHGR